MLSSCKPEVLEPNTYTVSFNSNGGTGKMEIITADEGSEITLAANTFTRMGYTFAEWNTMADGSGEKYADEAKIKLTANVTLYAQWTANNYTVTFDANDADGDAPAEIQATYDKEFALPENTFTKIGYNFAGWNTKADGSGNPFADKAKVKNLTAENNATVTLYAKWGEKDKVAKVMFSHAGGELDNGDTVTLSCTTEGATIYYVLVSGTQTPDLSKKEEYKAPITITDDITIAAVAVKDGMNQSDVVTATFTVKTYTVTFSTAHGTVPKQITGLKKGSKLTSDQLPTLTATGYTFDGWYNGETQFTTESEISADITLTAKWTANTYMVKFDANDATGSMESQTFTYGTSQVLNENKFTRTGYDFVGWATRADGEIAYNDKQNYLIGAENVTLYAKWEAINYTITYELDGGTNADGNPASYTIETVTVTLKEPTKDDFTFVCWYSDRSKKTEIAKGSTGDIVLQAVWKNNADFVKVPGVSINGSETWTPASEVFVSGRALEIKAFWMSDHEVTQAEWKDVMGSAPSDMATANDKDGNELTGNAADNNPVNMVSWYDAIVYCNKRSMEENLTPCYKVNGSTDPDKWGDVPTSWNDDTWDAATCDFTANGYRLPTDAEWEWAARGGENYTYAGSNDIEEVAWCYENTNRTGTREVKSKKANGYGLYDMSGNVFEWCWDWDSNISSSTHAAGASSGSDRVERGGSWDDIDNICEVASRDYFNPYYRNYYYGFRVVRTAE